jgi:hypothetical protein
MQKTLFSANERNKKLYFKSISYDMFNSSGLVRLLMNQETLHRREVLVELKKNTSKRFLYTLSSYK